MKTPSICSSDQFFASDFIRATGFSHFDVMLETMTVKNCKVLRGISVNVIDWLSRKVPSWWSVSISQSWTYISKIGVELICFEILSVRTEPEWDFTGPMVEHLMLLWKDLTRFQNSLLDVVLVSLLLSYKFPVFLVSQPFRRSSWCFLGIKENRLFSSLLRVGVFWALWRSRIVSLIQLFTQGQRHSGKLLDLTLAFLWGICSSRMNL